MKRSSSALVAAATLIGTSIEWYDFYIYGLASALVFPALFFPKSDPFVGQLASYAVFGVGFLARPLGGVIFGHFGDRLGRKAMLVLTLSTMGAATFLVGVLPIYARIGVWAPVLLVALRLCQGIAVGGEWGGAVLMASEHAHARAKGFVASFPQMGVPVGLILANLSFVAAGAHWRIPFLASAVLVALGLVIRLSVTETPAFENFKGRKEIVSAPVRSVLANNLRSVLLAGGAFFVVNGGFYLITTQLISYGAGPHSVLKLNPSVFFNANIAGSCVALVVVPLSGWISDRVGRRPIFMTAVAALFVLAFPIYALVDTKAPGLIVLAVCLFNLACGAAYGPLAAMLSEMFPANVRYSGVSVGYQGAAIFAGGLAPFVATLLLKYSAGASWVLALYFMFMTVISLVSICLIPETSGVDLVESRPLRALEYAG
ncbi:MAG TPA: MFS transporter [Candidatus Binatia bacterium]|nr:MFS transporter [Candidatus Binatia bacterium]